MSNIVSKPDKQMYMHTSQYKHPKLNLEKNIISDIDINVLWMKCVADTNKMNCPGFLSSKTDKHTAMVLVHRDTLSC